LAVGRYIKNIRPVRNDGPFLNINQNHTNQKMEKNYNHYKITLEEIGEEKKEPISVEFENRDGIMSVVKKLLGKDKKQCDIQDLSQFAWP